MPNQRNLVDALLESTKALPNGAAAVASNGFDTQNSPKGDFNAPVEVEIDAPALNVTELPDAKNINYNIESDTDVAFGSPKVEATIGTQTGAGAAGDAAAKYRYKLPTNVQRYIRGVATGDAAGDASTSNFSVRVLS